MFLRGFAVTFSEGWVDVTGARLRTRFVRSVGATEAPSRAKDMTCQVRYSLVSAFGLFRSVR